MSNQTANDAGLSKFDPATLKSLESKAIAETRSAIFMPATMAEAMELAKLMAASNFVPPHLRNKPGDCLAVVMISMRWEMDPFAVANKTYFVNDRIAYEAQLVNAVVNTRAPVVERPHVSWDGDGQNLTCKVVATLRGETRPKEVWQEIKDIKTKNSPLWVSSPRQQLAYYTTRMWARLYTPEVLLGVYTPDETEQMDPLEKGEKMPDGSEILPPRPKRRATPEQEAAAAERLAKEQKDAEDRASGRVPDTDPPHDPETGEIKDTSHDQGPEESKPENGAEPQPSPDPEESPIFVGATGTIIEKIKKTGSVKALNNLVDVVEAQNIQALPAEYRKQVETAIADRRAWFAR